MTGESRRCSINGQELHTTINNTNSISEAREIQRQQQQQQLEGSEILPTPRIFNTTTRELARAEVVDNFGGGIRDSGGIRKKKKRRRKLRLTSSSAESADNNTNKANKATGNLKNNILCDSAQVVNGGNKILGASPSEAQKATEVSGSGNKLKQQRQRQARGGPDAQRGHYFIDSRSILTNKERLKKFWEKRMEMDLEQRRKQRQQQLVSNGMTVGQQQQQQAANLVGKTKRGGIVDDSLLTKAATNDIERRQDDAAVPPAIKRFDENNNNNNDGEEEDFELMKGMIINGHRDEDGGRALSADSPRWNGLLQRTEEATAPASGVINDSGAKKREQEDNYVDRSAGGEKSVESSGKPAEDDEHDGRKVKNGNLLPREEATRDASDNEQATALLSETNEMPTDAESPAGAQNQSLVETQLMSIDPTLCHSSPEATFASEQDAEQRGAVHLGKSSRGDDDNSVEDFGNSDATVGQEVQTCNEEFSSSNSSFGPMSISIPCEDPNDVDEPTITANTQFQKEPDNELRQPERQHAKTVANSDEDEDDDEEQNSTQSGSVLTVINRLEDEDEERTEARDKGVGGEEEDDGDASDIGVAFESLQFDDEIKSSKHEQVEEERLLAAPSAPVRLQASKRANTTTAVPAANGANNTKVGSSTRFNSSEVRSVCNFITNAITDATKQVEKFIKRDEVTASASETHEANTANPDEGIQRATFVRQSSAVVGGRCREDETSEPNGSLHYNIEPDNNAYAGDDEDEIEVVEDYDDDDEDDEDADEGGAADGSDDDDDEAPRADLSSIFEANVRREIERFESNSMIRRVTDTGGNLKLANKNGNSTERKIAEEIRLFNEREQELKNRLDGRQAVATPSDEQHKSISSVGANSKLHTHDCVVRFGKTLQIPKSTASSSTVLFSSGGANNSHQFVSQESNQLAQSHLVSSRSIKLSTTSNGNNGNTNQPVATTMISMHKFISSGGKRFVYTTNSGGSSSASSSSSSYSSSASATTVASSSAAGSNNLKKSNISTSLQTLSSNTQRSADYKAVDSLNNKESPNVEPGLTKKVIETFSRLNNDPSPSNSGNANLHHHGSVTQLPNGSNQHNQQQHQATVSRQKAAHMSSAEWKIQEELRDMRAREAELKSLRSQRSSILGSNGGDSAAHRGKCDDVTSRSNGSGGRRSEPERRSGTSGGGLDNGAANLDQSERVQSVQRFQSNQSVPNASDKLSYSSDSLYPIKQTIDTFRKLNSSQTKANGKPSQQLQRKQHRRGDDQAPNNVRRQH